MDGIVVLTLLFAALAVLTVGVMWFFGRPQDADPPMHHRDPGAKQTHGT